MSYFDDKKNVEAYIKMAEGYDGRILIDALRQHLADGASVLELGMGPGTDFLMLSEHFTVTGSDYSQVFLDRFCEQHPDADLVQLDAVKMNIDRTFDCIYSNKVLHHLRRDELPTSLHNQARVLNPGGVLCHSFWSGDGEDEHHGLRFVYYTEDTLKEAIGKEYEILALERYDEADKNDSLYVILRKVG